MHPLIPILIAFAAGMVGAEYLRPGALPVYLLVGLGVASIVVCRLMGLAFRRYAAALAFLPLGALFILPSYTTELPPDHISRRVELTDRSLTPLGADVEAVVIEGPEYSGDAARLLVRARAVNADGLSHPVSGDLLLTVAGLKEDVGPGDEVRFVARLRAPANFGNPGEHDFKGALARKGIYATGYVKSPRFFVKTGPSPWTPSRLASHMRAFVRSFFDSSGLKYREPLKALVIGEERGIERAVVEPFSSTGTLHVLAISGQNVGVAAYFSYVVLLFLMKRSERLMLAVNVKKAAAALTLAPILLYGMVSGFPVSAERAVIMAFIYVLAFVMGRGKDYLNGAALAALIILAYTPWALRDVSFQLTFAAVFAIIVLVPRMEVLFASAVSTPGGGSAAGALAGRLKRWAAGLVMVTIAASIGTFPVLAYHFHRLPAAGLAANVVAVPLTSAAGALASAAALFSPLFGPLAYVLLYAADLVFGLAFTAVKFVASLPYSSLTVAPPTFAWIILFYLFVLSLLLLTRRRAALYAAPALAALLVLLWWQNGARSLDGKLNVTFLSVGQGDSAVIEFPDGRTMLIDGGGLYGRLDTGDRIVLPYLLHRRITRLDYMVLSHAQRDHMDGLGRVAAGLPVGEFWWNGNGGLKSLKGALDSSGASVKVINASTEPVEIGGALIEPLHPLAGDSYDVNDMSLALRISYGSVSFLFPGDVGGEAERALAERTARSTVLKSPHHGSKHSSSTELIRAAAPEWAVVSAGRDNPFGFPHTETIERYAEAGIKVLRTDRDGAVTFSTDGTTVAAQTHLTR